ncbi:hypothetical protein PsYK624_121740 [Phanerochaete sordida]|uniref:DUF6532 domain-containing protein n=1 Tax=Phanerochaete sordida TaxID=48140 RepID=A0A9P3LHX5_9APHY|nr:hypothetical protein PsYK624_121740 [Phanerochaete sordida]
MPRSAGKKPLGDETTAPPPSEFLTPAQKRARTIAAKKRKEQEDAQRVSELPRLAKVNALKEAIWTQADGKPHVADSEGGEALAKQKNKSISANGGKKKKTSTASKEIVETAEAAPKGGKEKKRKQKPAAPIPPALDLDDFNDNAPTPSRPLPESNIVVPAKRAGKGQQDKPPTTLKTASENPSEGCFNPESSVMTATHSSQAEGTLKSLGDEHNDGSDTSSTSDDSDSDSDAEDSGVEQKGKRVSAKSNPQDIEEDSSGAEEDEDEPKAKVAQGEDDEEDEDEGNEDDDDDAGADFTTERPVFVDRQAVQPARNEPPTAAAVTQTHNPRMRKSSASTSGDVVIITGSLSRDGATSNTIQRSSAPSVQPSPPIIISPVAADDPTGRRELGHPASAADGGGAPKRKKHKSKEDKASKKQRRAAEAEKNAIERPLFKENMTPVDEISKIKAQHLGKRTLENLQKWEGDYPLETRVKYNGKKGLNKTKQAEHIRALMDAIEVAFQYDFTFNIAIYPPEVRDPIHQQIVVQEAKKLGLDEVAKRAELDSDYAGLFGSYADHRNGMVRSGMKGDAATLLDTFYHLTKKIGGAEEPSNIDPALQATQAKANRETAKLETMAQVNSLLQGMAYAYPADPRYPGTVDGSRPFDITLLTHVITNGYFTAGIRTKQALATGKEDAFASSIYLRPHEKEMVPSMVAFGCASIAVALGEWTSGGFVRLGYNSTVAAAEFKTVMKFLSDWKEKRPDWYHTFMHKVYLNVCGGYDTPNALQSEENYTLAMSRACPPPLAPVGDGSAAAGI